MQNPHRPIYGIFGGSFNPVHQGHLDVVHGILSAGIIDHLFVIPANRSPFKDDPGFLPAGLRLKMIRRAMDGIGRVSVLDMEIRRSEPSYSLDTLSVLASTYPAARLKLIMGLDAFQGFPAWFGAAAILERADLIVIDRQSGRHALPEDPSAWMRYLPPEWGGRVKPHPPDRLITTDGRVVVERIVLSTTSISSTQIREQHRWEYIPAEARAILASYRAQADCRRPHGVNHRSDGQA